MTSKTKSKGITLPASAKDAVEPIKDMWDGNIPDDAPIQEEGSQELPDEPTSAPIEEPAPEPRKPWEVKVFTFPTGDLRVRVRAFNPIYSTQLLIRLGRIVGGPFGAAVSAFMGSDGDVTIEQAEALEGAGIERAVSSLFKRVDEAGVGVIIKDILCTTDVVLNRTGKAPVWAKMDVDRDFMLNEYGMMEVIVWSLRFHYQDFFTRSFNALMNKMKSVKGLKGKLEEIWREDGNSPSLLEESTYQEDSSSSAMEEVSLGLSEEELEKIHNQVKDQGS